MNSAEVIPKNVNVFKELIKYSKNECEFVQMSTNRNCYLDGLNKGHVRIYVYACVRMCNVLTFLRVYVCGRTHAYAL